MKCMDKNKVGFAYALFKGKVPIKDEYGNVTGEFEVIYGNPMEFFANISAARGETTTRQFGDTESYDKVIVMDNDAPLVDEYSVLWVDTKPQLNEDGTLTVNVEGEIIIPHDYIVKKVAKSMNSVSIAISKVNVSG